MKPPRSVVAVAFAWSWLGGAGVAKGQEASPVRPPIRLTIEACTAVEPDEVRRMVALELHAVDSPTTDDRDTTRIAVTCAGESANLHVDDPITGKSLDRTVRFVELDTDVRSRMLALSVAELVIASWTELETTPDPSLPIDLPAPTFELRSAAHETVVSRLSPPSRGLQFGDGTWVGPCVATRTFAPTSGALTLWGGGLGFDTGSRGLLGFTADALLEYGVRTVPSGVIRVATLSAASAAVAQHRWGVLRLRIGVGARAGVAFFTGLANDDARTESASVMAPWGGPLALASARVQVSRGVQAALAVEFGYAVFGPSATVNRVVAVTVGGPWIGIQIAIAL